MGEKDVRYELDGPVARITLDRPRYRNAQSWQMLAPAPSANGEPSI